MNRNPGPWDRATLAAQACGLTDAANGGLVPAIHAATTYVRNESYELVDGRLYSRADNPGYEQVERVLTRMEEGVDAALFASGNAAAAAVFQALRPGDRALIPQVMYWALRNWILKWAAPWGLVIEVVDMTDLKALEAALEKARTALVWVETPANPTLAVADIRSVAARAHEAGARLAVDSTFATPVHTLPLSLGADLVMHSATKYLNGHSDVVAGALITGSQDGFWEEIRRVRVLAGAVPGPFEAWLLLRGMRTLFLRVRTQSANAMEIARHFEGDARLEAVLYPGLESFPGHEVASRQMKEGYGGMLALQVRGGAEAALLVASRLKLWKRATSLGGVESLVEHRASVEGPESPVAPNLLRLSVGIETAADLIGDLDQALG